MWVVLYRGCTLYRDACPVGYILYRGWNVQGCMACGVYSIGAAGHAGVVYKGDSTAGVYSIGAAASVGCTL